MFARQFLAVLLLPVCAASQSRVDVDELLTFTDLPGAPNGAWCWYQDERVVVDRDHPEGPLLLIGSVSFTRPGDEEHGDVDVLWFNTVTGERGVFELHDRFQADDHDVPAFLIREDGRYLAVYTKHSSDPLVRWRVSTQPHDPTAWEPEQTYKNDVRVCYSNLFRLRGADDQQLLFDFSRSNGFDPNYFVSDDEGTSWTYGGKLLTGPDGNEAVTQRPYLRYAAAADGRTLHFIATEGHPHDEDNGIYHGALLDGRLLFSDGTDKGALATASTSEHRANEFTAVLSPGAEFDGRPMHNAWTVDLHVDDDGHPYALFQGRAGGDRKDHRFFHARWDGERWNTHEIAAAGGPLYAQQRDYTGLGALHPHDPDLLFVSTPIDPRNGERLEHYEIFMGATRDSGATWAWTPVTWGSEVDNLRPAVPIWDDKNTALLWLRGRIRTYSDWDSQIVGRVVRTDAVKGLRARGQRTRRVRATAPDEKAP